MSAWPETLGLGQLARGPVARSLEAGAVERARIARELGVDSLDELRAEVRVSPWLDGAEIDARWQAAVGQTCGVTLEPLSNRHAGRFTVRVVPAGSPNAPAQAAEVAVDPDAEDPPDVLEDDTIELGAYVVEHLALEIDPFPRKPGAEFEAPEPEEPPSPFAVLGALKRSGD
ncbi:MAG TPA: YceD family protein [Caulobacteraceae bacterium]